MKLGKTRRNLRKGDGDAVDEVVIEEALAGAEQQAVGGGATVHEEDAHLFAVFQVAQIDGEVDVGRDQHHGARIGRRAPG